MAKTTTAPYDVAERLRSREDMAAYLEASIQESGGDAAFVAKALGDIARARGMAQVASDAGLSRESLYKALSGERVPTFETVLRVVGALRLRLRAEALDADVRRVMSKSAVVERLKEFGETREGSDWSVLDCETEQLVRRNPFAFPVAVAFVRGMPWQKAWRIPVEIDHAGYLDSAELASMSEPDLTKLIDGLAVRPR